MWRKFKRSRSFVLNPYGISSIAMLLSRKWILNTDFSQNNCFKECSNMVVTPNLWVRISLYKKECLPVVIQNKKISSTQVVTMIYTLGKNLFETATFQGLWDVSFQVGSRLYESSLYFYRREDQINRVYGKKTLFSICRFLVWCTKE